MGGIDIATYPGGDEFYYMMNCKKAPLDDIYVRKALAYVVDYEKIVNDVYPGSPLATSCVPVGSLGYVDCQIYHRDVSKALEELQKSIYYPDIVDHPENYKIEVDWCAEVPPEEKVAMIFAECVERDLGLIVDVVQTPWNKMIQDMATQETSPHIETIFVALHYPEAGSLIESRYHSKSAPTWEQNEWLLNATLDAAIEDALSTIDRTERFSKYAELQRYIINLCPSLFLFDHMIKMAYQTYIDWPAARGEVIPIMGYNIDPRTIQVYPPS
ncbi:MAG: ABC transporter substrate-binding protein [Candidatus Bathyarchaeota archaeon]|nr:ABC transporter substrate-binding protein [Candidatus Bathyarchaeota archaeon]